MATNKRGRPATRKTTTATQKPKSVTVEDNKDIVKEVLETEVIETKDVVVETVTPVTAPVSNQDIKATSVNVPKRPVQRFDKYELVDVINNFNGKLIYVSSQTGYTFEWETVGEIQQMPVEELINMRNSQVAFYKNNWIEFDKDIGEELKRFLHVENHYKDSVRFEDIADLFKQSPDVIAEKISNMPNSAQDNLACMAVEMIENRELDSLKVIDAIEAGLGYKITETV